MRTLPLAILNLAAIVMLTACHLSVEIQTEETREPTRVSTSTLTILTAASATGSPAVATSLPSTASAGSNTISSSAIMVNDPGDGVVGCPEKCTLRSALSIAKDNAIIGFAPTITGTIKLSNALHITKNLTINGPGANVLTLDAGGKESVFVIQSSDLEITISGLTLQNGNGDDAGAIINRGKLTLVNSAFTNNTGKDAGAIFTWSDSSLIVISCTFWNNSGKTAGAIDSFKAKVSISNSTFSGNTSGRAGALHAAGGQWWVLNSTIVGNSTSSGSFGGSGGIVVVDPSIEKTEFTLGSSIVAANSSTGGSQQVDGDFHSLGANLFGAHQPMNDSVESDQQIVDATFGELTLTGPGTTPTIALSVGNPAIGNGNCKLTIPVETDQRGVARKQRCDIGAFETQ